MDNSVVLAEAATSTLRIFGFGFLAGSLFAILILLILDWMKSKREA